MSDFNPREPIRLSDIDNLLEDSIFNSSNGAKLAEYLKKKRGGGGRVRLHNIFEQVAANMPKPTFNFDMDSSEPNPLPESPQIMEQLVPEPVPTTSAQPVQNENVIVEVEVLTSTPSIEPPVVVAVPDARTGSPKTGKSPGRLPNLGRQALLNQYHRTNTAKCELLKQITSSTPKPDTNGSMSRISAFTTSISPIIESSSSPATVPQQAAAPSPVVNPNPISSILPVESVPPTQQVLAPCSQVPPTTTPRKVVIIGTPVQPGSPNMVIPETPSPVKVPNESPKVAHQIQPRKLTDTFNQLQNDLANGSNENENITSDESGIIEEEHPEVPIVSHIPSVENSIMRKSILKDADASSLNRRTSLRVSFSKQLVQEREISPAPSIPEAHYSSSSDDDDDDDSSESSGDDDEYQVVDEVYSDDGAECDPKDIHENYKELVGDRECFERQMLEIPERVPSPLINVVDEAPVRWYETRTPRAQAGDRNNDGLAPPATCAKENKTNLQLVDIITDWDEEDDDEEEEEERDKQEEQQKSPEKEPSAIELPETQPLTQHTNETICETMDITNVEDSAERLVELPPPLVSFNGSAQNPLGSPERALTPPSQFTDSAKRRFLRENDEALLSRLQNELPGSQQENPSFCTPDLVSETLVDVIQSFRDQPLPKPVAEESRKTLVPVRKGRRTKSTVDPATTTYFETVEKTFIKPMAPSKKSVTLKALTTAQKRKLYATTKLPQSPETPKSNSVELYTARMKNLNIVIRRLEVGKFLQRLTDADRAMLEGPTKAPKTKPKPNITNGKEISKNNRISYENGNDQKQPSESPESGTGSDSNEPTFAGFSDNEKVQSSPEELGKLLHNHNDPLETNNVARDVEPEEESNPQNVPVVEKVQPKPGRPHCTRNGTKAVGTSDAGVRNVRSLRLKAKNGTEAAKSAEVGVENDAEIRLTSNNGEAVQQRIPEAVNQLVEIERENEEQIISRKQLNTDNVENVPSGIENKKKRGRPRKGAVVSQPLVQLTEIIEEPVANKINVLQNSEEPTESRSSAPVYEILESVSSTSNTGESAALQPSLPEPQESATSLTGDGEAPSKDEQTDQAKKSTDSESREAAVTSTSSGIEVPLNVEAASEINAIESSESVPPVSSSCSDDIGTSEIRTDTENLPFKKRSLRHGSVDEPPALEPFGGERSPVETSDNEPPILVPHNPVPSTSKRSKRKKAEEHLEKHTTESQEKYPWWKSRYYQDRSEDTDETWIPGGKKQKDRYNRQVRKEGGRSGSSRRAVEPESPPVRRGSRQRRLVKSALDMHPQVNSVYDRPVYREMSSEEMLQPYFEAKMRAIEKAKATSTKGSAMPKGGNRKRIQEEPEEPITSKRNRPDNEEDQLAEDVQNTSVAPAGPRPTDTNVATEPVPPVDRLMQEKKDTYGWIQKLMHGNLDEDPRLPVVGDLVQYSLQHLSFKEHNGIQYSFYLRSDSENFGFLRFAPLAVKKLTKTSNFLLKFLVMAGNLSFNLNGNKISIASGDFLMLPENSKYGIENADEVSLLFMVKMPSQSPS